MSIIISENQKNAQRIEKTSFENEDKLQKYIYTNPESLPINEIKDESKLLIVSREYPTNSGPIDALGLDKDGDIYIIETKLYKNSDKRKVLAQVLDYGSALFFHSRNFIDFLEHIESDIFTKFNVNFKEKITNFFEFDNENYDSFKNNLEINLQTGNFKFVVLMDNIDNRLKDLIKYMNANSNFSIFGVEMEYYEFENYQIIIPKIFGTEIAKTSIRKKRFYKKWTNTIFFEELNEKLSNKDIEIVKTIYDFSRQNAKICKFGNGKIGTFLAVYEPTENKTTYSVDTNGEFGIYASDIINEKIKKDVIDFCTNHKFRRTDKYYFYFKISEFDKTKISNFLIKLKLLLSQDIV